MAVPRAGADMTGLTALITFLAFVVDWIVGDPQRWPHPVRLVGRLITFGEKMARRLAGSVPGRLEVAGAVMAIVVVAVTMGMVALVLTLAAKAGTILWFLASLYVVYSALCLRDLCNHTRQVEQALNGGCLEEARQRLSLMVGRDTAELDAPAIRRALTETLAENLSDGVVAPLFYLALGGPVLAWGYKAINTLDSMVGYKNECYLHLGRFAAKLDDVANYLPARLSALLIIWAARLTGCDWLSAQRIWRRDRQLHSSPNAGHPEAAMAGALGLWLGGPGNYGGDFLTKPTIYQEGGEPEADHLRLAIQLVVSATLMMLALVLVTIFLFTGLWGWGR